MTLLEASRVSLEVQQRIVVPIEIESAELAGF